MKGRVYWITGMPGSGKTTLGNALYYEMRETQDNVIILDGDILKQFVSDSVGYSRKERLARAKKYSNICKMLSEQGMYVIICTVALFDQIREWNRKNIDGYVEIFLDISLEVLKNRNKKGLYINNEDAKELFKGMEFPKDSDYVIKDGEYNTLIKHVEEIKKLVPRKADDYDRDKEYWNGIYEKQLSLSEPSSFAKDILEDMLCRGGNVLELGCGNGRDALFFAENGLRVTGIDASEKAIRILKEKYPRVANFVCDDFVKCEALFQIMYDSIYSRFTLHAISEEQENELLDNIKKALKKGGKVYIEARSINDDLYGLGEKVDKNAYIYDSHYRRFIDLEELTQKMIDLGFDIISAVEDRGFSVYKEQDPVLLRVIASLKESSY